MKKTILYLFLFGLNQLFFQSVSAQRVAGYMGKRTLLGLHASYMPNLYGLLRPGSGINYNGESQFYMLNPLKFGVSAGYVVKNHKTIVLDVEYQRMGVLNYNFDPYSYSPSDALMREVDVTRSTLLALKLRFQNAHQHCAPAGQYGGLTLGYTQFNNSYLDIFGKTKDAGSDYDWSIGYAGGLRRIYKDKLVLDLSLEYNLNMRAVSRFIKSELNETSLNENIANVAIYKNFLNNILVTRAAVYYLF